MGRTRYWIALCAAMISAWCSAPAWAGDVDNAGAGEQRPAAAALEPAPTHVSPFKVGIDSYLGTSNLEGSRRFSDGMWAGSTAAYPSVAYLRWDNGKGFAAKLSLGTGRLYNGPDSLVDQPVEAWWQVPAGKLSVTVGKFWVPFGQQEWQYESKPGVMLQWAEGEYSLAASANYNRRTRSANAYLRLGRNFGQHANLGLSLGTGKGLSYDTEHDRGWALDGTATWRGWRFNGEYEEFRAPDAKRFRFAYGKLSYDNLGNWKPFLAAYDWNDDTEAFGKFDSTVYGLNYQVTPQIALEGAYAPTSSKNISWLQVHWTWER